MAYKIKVNNARFKVTRTYKLATKVAAAGGTTTPPPTTGQLFPRGTKTQ